MLEIIFIHIPKTAGTTVVDLLKRNFRPGEVVHYKKKLYTDIPKKRRQEAILNLITPNSKVLYGHFSYQDLKLIIQEHPHVKVVTFVRKPADRVISDFKYFKTRILTGSTSGNKSIKEPLITFARRSGKKNLMSSVLKGISLESLYFLGIFESFEDDARNLLMKLNLEADSIPKTNINTITTNSDITVTPFHKAMIAALNYQDLILYQKALRLKKKQSSKMN